MRYFNTSGPCDPRKHYTLLREPLLRQGKVKVENGRFFTIFAPRQSGKTTYFQLLLQELKTMYTPLWISCENQATSSKDVFYQDMERQLRQELAKSGISFDGAITNKDELEAFFEQSSQLQANPFVLVIDEFEGVPQIVISELMHTFRRVYHRRDHSRLQSLILVGVSSVAELVVSSASPFNVVDELEIPYFTCEEVHELIQQYVTETGQVFDAEVIKAIYDNTHGQPGLVCGLCQHLVEQVVTDRKHPVTMDHFYKTLQHFLTERFDKNIINIVQKARSKQDFMLRLLFQETPIPFSVHHPDIAYLYAHGVVQNVNNHVEIGVPLYQKAIIIAFRPLINGEADFYFTAKDTFGEYVTAEGLNLHAILEKYRQYIRKRGYQAFDTAHLKEAAWHYSLDGFINFFLDILEGQTFIEVPSGRGRTDILILHRNRKYIIETKVFTNNAYFQKGKRQLAEYLQSEGLNEGYYVVFSSKHSEADQLDFVEEVNGKRIYTYLICTQFERATDKHKPSEAKK
ncbi:hypothetical protein U27_04236 [Candidatus Vecturithrix granuli]|uniref:AAA+ ATPase domain-containing protein n=1 Tax=Vecturithrix granuli TaxID=1499967 RepID=A0A081BY66_VECG1|nr:hypothetical protein U27_04236 [Candidatus Vecturithrix granuli]